MIVITGMDGCGKSTLIKGLYNAFKNEFKIKTEVVSVWDVIKKDKPGTHFLQVKGEAIDNYASLIGPQSRFFFILHLLSESLRRALEKNPEVLLVDAYWYKYLASVVGMGGDMKSLVDLTKIFPVPDVVFRLKLDSKTAFSRKSGVTGFESGFKGQAAFVEFQIQATKALDVLVPYECCFEMDGSSSPDQILQDSIQNLKSMGILPKTAVKIFGFQLLPQQHHALFPK